jgi:hypothetical protein
MVIFDARVNHLLLAKDRQLVSTKGVFVVLYESVVSSIRRGVIVNTFYDLSVLDCL